MKPQFTPFILLSFMLLATVGCSKSQEDKGAVAQVGNSVLTLEALHNNFPKEYNTLITKEQYLDFIKRWMDEEILYQYAVKEGMLKTPHIQEKLYDLQKKLVVDHLITQELSDVRFEPEEASIKQYFEVHQEDFLRQEPEVKLLEIKVKSKKLALEIQTEIKGDNFFSLVTKYSEGLKPESPNDILYRKKSELSSCLAEKAFELNIGEISEPLSCFQSASIILIVERQELGTQKELNDVRDEISAILKLKWYERYLTEKIDELKKEIYFSSNPGLVP